MTVDELRAVLEGLDPDTLVVMSKDAEGNNFSPLAGVEPDTLYVAQTGYGGECFHPDGWDDYYTDDYEKAVCLWPTN